ncbi:MAG: hypothetical protein IPJ65_27710 [Archangiaceae bacterium]|nr:hypothetical protein [Archangiaceae bacterium]
MKFIRDLKRRAITMRFESAFSLRDAIGLPGLVARLPVWADVILDFSDVRWMRESAVVALIPALASIHGRKVTVRGLESASVEHLEPIAMAA